ncbi:melatonin receptor type 1B-A-like [Patiria miniata]|uniref:G-protein coupled receptors family 1 profile domain-containing protein n=1 Tax=Patiria miniata TaxID=46514 RepID=A0A913YZ89_PATMI|nr:melatonin receptor type 1B-A-like [Patiria miniata]
MDGTKSLYHDEYSDDFLEGGNSTDGSLPFEFSDYNQRVLVAVLYLIASVLGISGNSLVIMAVILSRKLRTTTNAFVVNLSVADLLTSVVIIWDAVELLGKDGQPISDWICRVVSGTQTITTGCSIYTLALIGLQRLLLITRPMTTYRAIYTPNFKIVLWLVAAWSVSLLVTVLPLLFGVGGVGYNPKYHHCGFMSSHPLSTYYNIIIAGALYPIPLIIIVVCYVLIWLHLNRHAKRMVSPPDKSCDSIHMEPRSVTSTTRSLSELHRAASQPRLDRRQNEITKNMFYVVCAFILCLTPFAICLFYEYSDPVLPYATVTLVFNGCVNPLIYATKHRDFKTVFGCILRRRWNSIPEPSDFLKAMRRTNCCGDSDENSWV